MKKILLLFSLLSILLILGGCATTSSDTTQSQTADITASMAPKGTEDFTGTPTLLLSETKFQKSGQVDTKSVNTYQKGTDKLVSTIIYDNANDVIEKISLEYKGNNINYTYQDKYDTVLRKKTTVTNQQGAELETKLFDSAGKQISRYVYSYNSDFSQKTKWEIYGPSNTLLGYNTYTYENGLLTRIDSYDPQGALEEYFLYIYDKNNNMKETKHLNSAGKNISGATFEYNNSNRKATEKIYKDGKLLNEIAYEYFAQDGIMTERKVVKSPDSKRTVIEIIEKEYVLAQS